MITITLAEILIALTLGIVLGMVFFIGLWLTVKNLANTARPMLLLLLSWSFRFGIVMVVFYYLITQNIQQFIIALIGMSLVRWKISNTMQRYLKKEYLHGH